MAVFTSVVQGAASVTRTVMVADAPGSISTELVHTTRCGTSMYVHANTSELAPAKLTSAGRLSVTVISLWAVAGPALLRVMVYAIACAALLAVAACAAVSAVAACAAVLVMPVALAAVLATPSGGAVFVIRRSAAAAGSTGHGTSTLVMTQLPWPPEPLSAALARSVTIAATTGHGRKGLTVARATTGGVVAPGASGPGYVHSMWPSCVQFQPLVCSMADHVDSVPPLEKYTPVSLAASPTLVMV